MVLHLSFPVHYNYHVSEIEQLSAVIVLVHIPFTVTLSHNRYEHELIHVRNVNWDIVQTSQFDLMTYSHRILPAIDVHV